MCVLFFLFFLVFFFSTGVPQNGGFPLKIPLASLATRYPKTPFWWFSLGFPGKPVPNSHVFFDSSRHLPCVCGRQRLIPQDMQPLGEGSAHLQSRTTVKPQRDEWMTGFRFQRNCQQAMAKQHIVSMWCEMDVVHEMPTSMF